MSESSLGTVLITGGAGYIGSHTAVEIVEAGYKVVIVDSLINSHAEVINRLQSLVGTKIPFHNVDLNNPGALDRIFKEHNIDIVLHFAGFKAVGESVKDPMLYYRNNVQGTISLLQIMESHRVRDIVFSSSCTVYGDAPQVPVSESTNLQPTNPYGRSKLMNEEILKDLFASNSDWAISILRYFNPIGAHESGNIGEDPLGTPDNLLPYIAQVAIGRRNKLKIFGNDYPTKDGTCVRDYIHVVDLAKGHLEAMEYILPRTGTYIHNLGTGKGYSVLEVVRTFEKVCDIKVPFEYAERRDGDVAKIYANPQKANQQLGWEAKKDLKDMCRDMWNWQQKNPSGYESI